VCTLTEFLKLRHFVFIEQAIFQEIDNKAEYFFRRRVRREHL